MLDVFWKQIVESFKDGLLIAVKYITIIVIIIYAYLFMMDTRQQAINGNQAAMAIKEYQDKGILPRFPISEKVK